MNYTKLWLIMRLTTVILLITLMQVSAAGFAQKMTFVKKGATLEQIFTEIRKQTGYFVVYADNKINDDARLDVNFKNTELKDVLDVIGNSQNLNYSFAEKNISFKPKEPSFLERMIDRLAAIDVRGRVVDENGQPLAGATVRVKGTNRTVTTNIQGEFYFNSVDKGSLLQISYLGFNTKEIIANSDLGNIRMEIATSDLEEVAVSTGYWTTTKSKSLGNIAKVNGKDINDQPVTSLLMALQGRAAGVDVFQVSGTPGSAPAIRIRGQNSLRFDGGYPLYIVDGVPVDSKPVFSSGFFGEYDPLNSLNPANIESINILKDADATSIYGSRGANGVIVITTKKAIAGKTSADFNVYRGVGQISNKLDLISTSEYLAMRRESFRNNDNEEMTEFTAPDVLLWDTTRYTDWQDVLLGGKSEITDLQSSISGGNANTSFRFSGGYHKETTIFPGDFNFQRFTGSFSVNHLSTDGKFAALVSANYGTTKNSIFDSEMPISLAYTLPPNAPNPYNEDGTLNWSEDELGGATWVNPMAEFKRSNDVKSGNLMFNGVLSYKIGWGLLIKANLGYTDLNSSEILKIPISVYSPGLAQYYSPESRWTTEKRQTWISEPQLSYSKMLGLHNIEAFVGMTFQQGNNDSKNIGASNYSSDGLLGSLKGASNINIRDDDSYQYRYTSAFARMLYNYNEKYFASVTARSDGSSRFGGNNRFGNFGSVGAAWVFSNEKFVSDNLPFLSRGKLRGSFGSTGNDQIGDYRYIKTYENTPLTYQGAYGLLASSLFNPDFQWEVSKKVEAAMELSFFKGRVNMEIAWYRHRSSNLLIEYQLPGTSGFGSVLTNLDAAVENKGWEYTASVDILDRNHFRWSASINFSRPRNELVRFDDIQESTYANQYVVGQPLDVLRLYNFTGVDPQTGLYTYLDVDDNGTLDEKDRTSIKNSGRTYFGGVQNSIRFKGIEFSALFQFVNLVSQRLLPSGPFGSLTNVSRTFYENRWREVGDVASVQKFSTGYDNGAFANFYYSDAIIEKSSFVRLKTLSLSYSLPEGIADKTGLNRCRLYLQGQNLFTLTNYSGLDPETGNANIPPLRIVSLGIQVGI